MALAKKCDRYGKLYEHYPVGKQPGVFNAISMSRRDSNGVIDRTKTPMDMCPNCMALFEKFMKEGKNNESI